MRLHAFATIAAGLSLLAAAPTAADEPPAFATMCADAVGPGDRPDPSERPFDWAGQVPRSDGQPDAALADAAAIALNAYAVYRAFDAGEDPATALASGLDLVGFIYGEPGPNTERRPGPARPDGAPVRTRTLYGYVARVSGTTRTVVAFRGTMEPTEWTRNLQPRQVRHLTDIDRQVRVHRGFKAIYDTLELETPNGTVTPLRPASRRGLFNRLSPLDLTEALTGVFGLVGGPSAGETLFVGHSLGGALATLAAVETAARDASDGPVRAITFAAPRVGDLAFARLAADVDQIQRVCNMPDVVPALPASTPRITYTHVGDVVRQSTFDHDTRLTTEFEKQGDAVGCYHSMEVYRAMLDPAWSASGPCFD